MENHKNNFYIQSFMPQAGTVLNVFLVCVLCFLLLRYGLPLIGIYIPPLTDPANNNNSATPNNSSSSTPSGGWFYGGGPSSPVIITPSSAQINVYSNYNCSTKVSSLDWGMLNPDSSKNLSCYIKNEGNVQVTLNVATSNWVFKDENGTLLSGDYKQYFLFSWNGNATVLQQNQIFNATFTLFVSLNIQDVRTFGFDINISAL